eukprot:CAMPEP_0184317686 /NCGR_PEP_ID=MMETSP1049-20130417/98123_1 /TAXON_ID=77928 /ORGANISM="Proteomonas sulcata, Strain CCMP704" /LENGTH=50 /DNA_ID=CAMNT_0026637173 /DNA_START=58 /DNA_END=207 /DNA_ORIENTATION=-
MKCIIQKRGESSEALACVKSCERDEAACGGWGLRAQIWDATMTRSARHHA